MCRNTARHGKQLPRIVLLIPHQDGTRQGRRCNHYSHRCRSRQIFGGAKDSCTNSHKSAQKLGTISFKSKDVARHFCSNFQGVCEGFQRCCPDIKGFCPAFRQIKTFKGALAPPAPTPMIASVPWSSSRQHSIGCGQQDVARKSLLGHSVTQANHHSWNLSICRSNSTLGINVFHSWALCGEVSYHELFANSISATWTWDRILSVIIQDTRPKNRNVCGCWKQHFCHHKRIKLTQNCVWFTNPCIDLLAPPSVTR